MLKFAAPSIRNGGQSQLPLPAGPGGVFPRRPWRCLWLDHGPQWPAGRTRKGSGLFTPPVAAASACGHASRGTHRPTPSPQDFLDLRFLVSPPRASQNCHPAQEGALPGAPHQGTCRPPPASQASQTRHPFLHIAGFNCLYCVSGLKGKVSHHQNASLSRRVALLWAFLPQKDPQ